MRVKAIDFVVYEPVDDVEQAVSFYRDTLGMEFPFNERSSRFAEFDTPPVAFVLRDKPRLVGTPAVALAVDDVRAAVKELRAKGVKVLIEPYTTTVCRVAFIEDPFGNRVCLHQR